MGVLGDVIGGIVGALPGAIGTGYNIWANKRDFDYQKALQQQIFEREDTAVQRRVEDLKAAGLNPALANGSEASAGSVVSRSNTNDVNFGAALDTLSALQQIKNQKVQNENQKMQGNILEKEDSMKSIELTLDRMNLFNQLGIFYGVKPNVTKDGKLNLNFNFKHGDYAFKEDMPFYKLFDYQYQNMKNNAEFMQKDLNWYIADKVYGYLSPFIPQLKFNMNQSQSTNTNNNTNRNYSDNTNRNYNYNYRK